jgi:hypothetical protein
LALTALVLFFSFFKEWEGLSNSRNSKNTWAAFDFRNAIGVFANKFTFWFRTVGFVAFPVTFGFFTNWFAFGFGSLAMSNTVGLFANSNAFRTIEHFTAFIWAFNFAFWFFAFYITNGVFRFSTACVAFRRFTYWVTNCWAMRIITFP